MQEALAVSARGVHWFLLNASPEIRAQIESFPALWPQGPRQSPIAGILLTNGDLDHTLGLLSLRESHPLNVYATETVQRGFAEGNVLYRTLQRFEGQVTWRTLRLDEETRLAAGAEADDLWVTPFAVPGKRPVHLEGAGPASDEDNIGLLIRAAPGAPVCAYVPAAGAWTPDLASRLAGAEVVFFDGTFWASDELVAAGLGTKRAEDMAHVPVGGAGGTLERLSGLGARRRILIHINNTNPILREGAPERAAVEAAGVEVAFDQMELVV